MQKSRGAPRFRKHFKKRTSKNPKKQKTNDIGKEEEDDEKSETGSRRNDEENLAHL